MALPAGYVLVEPQKTKLPEGYTLVSQKNADQDGLPSIVKKAPAEEPREAPTYDPLGQVIGDVPAPMDYTVEGQGKMNEPGAFTTIADLAKQFIAPGVKAPFALPQATETAVKGFARQAMEGTPEAIMPSSVFQPGLDTEETLFGPETDAQKARRKLQAQRAVAAMPSIPGAAALNKIGENVQKDIQNSLSPEAKKALQESQITGNIFKGEVDFGKNPSAYGYALQAANVFGSMAPVIATAMVTKSPGIGGYVGGTMAADEAATSAAEFINKIPDAELRQKSPFYAELIAGGASPKEARALTIKKAAESGAILQGLVATFGDVLTGKLVTGAFDKAIAKLGTNRLARAGGVGAASSLEEALQETGEGLSSDVTLKNVIPSKELGEDSAANFILGALGGAGPGVVKGALSEGEAKEPGREKYVKPEGGLAELIARQKGFLTPQGTPPAPPSAPPAFAQTPMPPAPPAGPEEIIEAPVSESRDTQAMLEELINSVNYPGEKAPEVKAEEPAKMIEAKTETPAFDATGWTKSERTINKKTGEPNLPEGVERYTKEEEDGTKRRILTRNGEVTQSETTTPKIQLTNSSFGDEGETIAGNIKINELNGTLHFFPDGGGPVIKMSPRASQQYKEGVPVNKIAELEFSDAGGIRPDGTKTPHTTTSKLIGAEPKAPAKQTEAQLEPDEAFGITGGAAPQPQEFVEAKQAVDEVTKQVIKMRAKPAGSLWSKLTGALDPEEVREIFGNNPNLGQRKLQVVQGKGRGSYIVDLVDNGTLDAFLPPDKRHDANNFDATESAQLIKDAIGERDYLPFDAKTEIEMMFGSVKDAEDLVKEYLTQEEQNRELQIAADEQREADQNAEITKPSDKNRPAGTGEREALKLTSATPEEIRARLTEQERRTKEEERAKKAAEDKAKADEQAADFTLTGSDREADVAAARGQQDIFAAAPPESPKPQTEQERTVSIPKKEFREDKETRGKSDHPALKMVFEGMTPKGLIEKYGEKDVRFLGRLFDIDVKDKFNVAKKLIALDKGLSLIRGKTKADYDKMNKEMLGGYLEAVGQSKFGRKYEMIERLLRYETNVMGKFYDNLQDLKHKAAILNQARAGKPISEEVLKDYPDVAAYTLPRDSDGYKAAIRTLAVKSLPTLGMDTPATIAAYREDAKTTKDPLEKYVAADIADYMEQYYKGQTEKRNKISAQLDATPTPTMTSMGADLKRVKAELAALEKGEFNPVELGEEFPEIGAEAFAYLDTTNDEVRKAIGSLYKEGDIDGAIEVLENMPKNTSVVEKPVDNKKEIADLKKEQKTLMLQIIKAGLEETPEQEARMAEIDKRLRELEGKPAIQKEEKPAVKQRSVEEIEEELQDLEDQLDGEFNKDKRTALVSQIFKLQGELTGAEGKAKKAAAEGKPQSRNKLDDPVEFAKALKGFEDAYGNQESALSELKYYKNTVDSLIKKGGSIYRVIFVKSVNDIDEKNLGNYWTIHSSNIDRYIGNLGEDAGEDAQPYVIEAKVPPNSVSNEKVDIAGNPDEEEVNIVANKDDITYTVHEYNGKQVGPAIRELGKEEPTEEPEAPEGTVATPDGAVLRYPLAVSMVGEGYKVLALDDPRTYKDKGGEPHRTFEKGPLRIAMTPQRVLFQNRNSVNVAFGNPDQVTLEAIMVDPGKRNQGLATQAMNDIIEAADKNEITLYLEPVPIINIKKNDFGLDRDQLVDFYSKFGFEFQEDSNKVMQRKPSAEVEVLPAEEPQIAGQVGFEPYTIEGDFTEVAEEQQRLMLEDQTENLSDAQVKTLEQHYGAGIDTDEFFTKLREDVSNFIVKGAAAVNGKIRAIIRQLANGVLAVGIAFNPQYMSQPVNVFMPTDNVRTEEVLATVPDAATAKMSEPAKRAFAVIYPAIQEQMQAKDKLFVVADKPSGRVFVFNPDGSLLLEKKSLFGLAKGDIYVGDNDKPQNRITPAGLFDLKLVDAQKGASEKRTAGDYDTGTVLAINDPDGTITIMHSVWLKEKDGAQRAAALRNESAADSRYSFGCINVDAPTYSYLVNNHYKQMDGAALFIVPEAGTDVMSFITGKGAMSEDLARIKIKPVTKEVRTPQRQATQTEAKTKTPGREQQFFSIEPQTQTQAFKKWFGDSKVVDADGKPLVVYHGTIVRPDTESVKGMGDIMAFDRMFTTQFRAPSIDTVGSFFSTNPGEGGAQMYSGTGEGAAIYPVYLSIKNPYTTTFETMLRRARIMENGVDDGRKIGAKEVEALRRFLKETGRDGIHIKADPKGGEFGNQDVWIALEPEQVKSATGNIGTFDESAYISNSLSDAMINGIDEDNKKRSPSLVRTLKTYNRMRKDGRMSEDMFIMMSDAAIREDEQNKYNKPIKDRERGADWIREKLLNAKRNGFLSEKAVDMAEWFIGQNPDLVYDLGISIRGKGETGVGGFYNSLSRVVNLIKEGGNDATTVHEILHHLERMMPAKVQDAIRKAWATQLVKAQKAAKTPAEKLYFAALIDAHYGDNDLTRLNVPEGAGKIYSDARMALMDMKAGSSSTKLAEMLLKMEAVPMGMYQYFNASEFWAVNASRIVESRFDAVKAGNLARLKTWLSEFGQKIKSLFGLKSDAAVLRALSSLSKATGEFQSDKMLGEGEYRSIERRNYLGEEAPEPDMEIPEMSFMDDTIYKFGDKLIDTKRLIQAINTTGKKLDERFDAYMKEENYHGRLAKRTKNFLNDEMRPVLEDMQEKGVTLDELETFLLNRHAKEANAYIAKINPIGFPDAGSSVSDEAADKYMAELTPEKRKDLTALAAKVDEIVKETQRVLVANGLETQDTIDEWNKTYKHYVPLQRDNLDFVHTGRGVMGGFGTRGSASKRRVGSDKPVIDIFANIAMQRERALRRSEQARVGRALYGMAIKHPNPGFWLAINPDAIKDKDKLEAELISLGLTPDDAKNIIQEPRQPMFDKKTKTVKYQVNPLLRDSPNVFPVRINGEDRFIFFNPNDPRALRMVQSIRNLDTETLGTAIGMAGMVTRWFASVNTQYNIVFGGVNFLRDLGAASLNLSTTEIAGKEKEVRAYVLPALRAIYRDLRGKGATDKSIIGISNETRKKEMAEMQEWFECFQLAGGQTGYQNQFAKTKRKGNVVEQELKRLNRGNVKKSVDWLFDWLSDYNDAIENAVRLAAFRVAVEKGKLSDDKAASIAKNLTVNFNRKGAKSGFISALYAFFNAAVQGSARMVETLRGPLGKKIIFGGMFLGAMQAVILAMAGFDDDEPPEFVKDKNLIIPIPFTDKKYLSVPMPLGFNMFPGFGRLAMEALLIETGMIRSRKGPGDKVMSAVSLVFDAFNPLGNAGNPLLMAMPTILDPFAAIYSNRDAFGRPIYREDKGTAPTPGYERSRENASLFSKKLAEAINWATSPAGTKHTKGFFSPTADQIDYFIGQVTGGVGREIMKIGEFAKSKAVTQEEVPAYKLPVVGRFYGEAESPAATRSRFYENVTVMSKHEHEIKGLRKDRTSPAEYIKANPEARLWQRANNVENQISRLNKEKRALIEKDAPREVIKRKEDEILKKMQQFNDQVKRGQ